MVALNFLAKPKDSRRNMLGKGLMVRPVGRMVGQWNDRIVCNRKSQWGILSLFVPSP